MTLMHLRSTFKETRHWTSPEVRDTKRLSRCCAIAQALHLGQFHVTR
jgi:hypothetical protein